MKKGKQREQKKRVGGGGREREREQANRKKRRRRRRKKKKKERDDGDEVKEKEKGDINSFLTAIGKVSAMIETFLYLLVPRTQKEVNMSETNINNERISRT